MSLKKDIIIVGGGAAGFFTAINIAEKHPKLSIAILEKSKTGLQKVKISGGGRCNVTHAEFIPEELSGYYPRGQKELIGPFHRFMTGDTMAWFEDRGVELKIEDDGRVFPVSNSSQTIIDCFLKQVKKYKIEVLYNHSVHQIRNLEDSFEIHANDKKIIGQKIVVTTGSNPKFWNILKKLGHTIIPPVPSLFTFKIKDDRINTIPGIVVEDVEIKVLDTKLSSEGPLLITHVGLSAPSILKLSAYGALELAKKDYKFQISVNFAQIEKEDCLNFLLKLKKEIGKKTVFNSPQFCLPKRLWRNLVFASGFNETIRWGDVSKPFFIQLSRQLTEAIFEVNGKNTFKEEFVTAGGVDLKEINFKTFESKIIPNLFFAGEVLNIDAVTGGFNFQNAWTGGFIVSNSI